MLRFKPPDVRVVLDTQVLLRGAVAGNDSLTAKIFEAWLDSRFELLLSEATLNEIERVLHRPEVLRKLRFSVIEAAPWSCFSEDEGSLWRHRCASAGAAIQTTTNFWTVPWRVMPRAW